MNRIRCTGATLWHRAARPFARPSGSASDVGRSVVGACRRQVILPQRMSVESSAHRRPALHSVSDRAIAEDRCRSLPRTADCSPVIHHHWNRAPAIRHHPSDLAPTGHASHSPAPTMFRPPLNLALADALALEEIREQGATLLQRHSPRRRCFTTPSSSTCADCTPQCSGQSEKLRADLGAMRTSDCAALSVVYWQWLSRAIRAVTSTARGNTPRSASRHGWRARIRLGLRPCLPR